VFVFGGSADNKKRNDVIKFDSLKSKFFVVKPDDPEKRPCERDFHGACIVNDELYVIGGSDQQN
jgi:hypothetical protein